MGLISAFLLVSLISFSTNNKFSESRKVAENPGSRSFFIFRTNSISQRACNCVTVYTCSCCEDVKILYTSEEKRLCFNMIYQRNGLNFDISLDSLMIKAMTVANYRPFQMCSSVPGLLFSSVCVHILELHQFSRSITVCPRVEVIAKKERWQITYTCSSLSTILPAVTPQMAANGTQPMMVRPAMQMLMPGVMGMMPGAMGLMPGAMGMMIAGASTMRPMPGGAGQMGPMMPGAAQMMGPMPGGGALIPRPPTGGAGMGQMMPPASAAGQRPAGAPPAMGQMPGAPTMVMGPTAGGAMGQRPGGAPMPGAPGAQMPGPPGAPMPRPPGAPMPGAPGAPMPGAPGVLMPRPPGASMPGAPGAPMPGSPGAPMPGAPGAPMAGAPGAPMPRPPGAPMPAAPGVPMPGAPGAPMPRPPGAPMPGAPGAPMPRPPAGAPMPRPPAGAPMPSAPGAPMPGAPGAPMPGAPGAPMPRPPGAAMPGALMPGAPGAPPMGQMPPPMGQMPPGGAMGQRPAGAPMPGQIVPRLAGGATVNTEALALRATNNLGSMNYLVEANSALAQEFTTPVNLMISNDQELIAEASYDVEHTMMPYAGEEDLTIYKTQEVFDYTTQPLMAAESFDQEFRAEYATDKKIAVKTSGQQVTNEHVTESIKATVADDNLRILKRQKRNLDMFDVLHQSNRCERAYRICVTRSKHYIVSRLKNSRNGHKTKKNECSDKPARIVYGYEENLCPHLSTSDSNDSVDSTAPHETSDPVSPPDDSLDAIIVNDESSEGSDFYPQSSSHVIPIISYSRPEIFPMRTPPLIALQVKEELSKTSNDTLIFDNSPLSPHIFNNKDLERLIN